MEESDGRHFVEIQRITEGALAEGEDLPGLHSLLVGVQIFARYIVFRNLMSDYL